jgi:hypothetical protein
VRFALGITMPEVLDSPLRMQGSSDSVEERRPKIGAERWLRTRRCRVASMREHPAQLQIAELEQALR